VSDLKRISLVLVLALALTLVFVGSAYANFGPHGGYIEDTDSCAGCHRAHTSFSTLKFRPRVVPPGWTDAQNPSSLLVGSAATMSEFCNACHGDQAPGASTNVVAGLFDAGPTGPSLTPIGGDNDGVTTLYRSGSRFGAPLNGGGFAKTMSLVDWETSATPVFEDVTSTHSMEQVGMLWGAGQAVGQTMDLTCTNCHDPHGSSNYRLLKDDVNGSPVGGYFPDGSPNGMVFSVEPNYPYADDGWLKHQAGQDQMAIYEPNYTSGSSQIRAGTRGVASLSTWCSGCHQEYDETATAYDYGAYEAGGADLNGATPGGATRHRHPVDITLQQGDDILQVAAQEDGVLDRKIPLEVNPGVGNSRQNQLGCLTCHFAHGSNATMSGWAAAHLTTNSAGTWVPEMDTTPGVEPDKADVLNLDPSNTPIAGTSALLRTDNRGVCERCHDK